MIDTTDRREWEERQKILVHELQHRTRNLMGVVRAVTASCISRSKTLADFRQRFEGTLGALSRVQGMLSRLNEQDRVAFDELVLTELAAMNADMARVRTEGPPGIKLRSSTLQTLGLALHELATNAVKYGALGQAGGNLSVKWRLEPGRDGKPWLHVDWQETGIAMLLPKPEPGGGYGRELIEQALPYQLRAKTTFVLGPEGLRCTIAIPISDMKAGHDYSD